MVAAGAARRARPARRARGARPAPSRGRGCRIGSARRPRRGGGHGGRGGWRRHRAIVVRARRGARGRGSHGSAARAVPRPARRRPRRHRPGAPRRGYGARRTGGDQPHRAPLAGRRPAPGGRARVRSAPRPRHHSARARVPRGGLLARGDRVAVEPPPGEPGPSAGAGTWPRPRPGGDGHVRWGVRASCGRGRPTCVRARRTARWRRPRRSRVGRRRGRPHRCSRGRAPRERGGADPQGRRHLGGAGGGASGGAAHAAAGVCILPAFLAVGVVPMLLAVVSSTLGRG